MLQIVAKIDDAYKFSIFTSISTKTSYKAWIRHGHDITQIWRQFSRNSICDMLLVHLKKFIKYFI